MEKTPRSLAAHLQGRFSKESRAQLAEDARKAVERGFRTIYLKVGTTKPEEDVELVAAIREGAGKQALIRVDASEAWSSGAAIRIIPQMERYKLELVEQPVSTRNLTEMAYVRSRIETPVLANEASWTPFRGCDVFLPLRRLVLALCLKVGSTTQG